MRRQLEFSKKQLVSINLYSDYIIIAKTEYSCCFCGSKYNMINYKKNYICNDCITEIVNYLK